MLLENKTAVITGGGRGIGRSIAMHFAREGANVAILARTTHEINEVSTQIGESGGACIAISADISNEREILDSFEKIHSHLGQIDILVNNAGVELRKPFVEISLDEWDQNMNINARSVVVCTKAVLSGMLKRREGNIINMASGAGLRGFPGSSVYGASKAAVIALTHALADEIREQGVRVNVICPGPIKTDSLAIETLTKMESNVLLPDDVAGTALFLASKLSGDITGQVFSIRNTNRW